MTATIVAGAESPADISADSNNSADNPVAHVRDAKSWELGPFFNWGTGVGGRSDYKFLSGRISIGKDAYPCSARGNLQRPV